MPEFLTPYLQSPVYLFVVGALILVGLGGYAYYRVTDITTQKITEDLHVLFGLGGNVAVLRTGAGAR